MNYLAKVTMLFLGLPFRAFGPMPGYGLWKRVYERRVAAWWKEHVLTTLGQFHQRNFLAMMYRSPFLETLQRDGGYDRNLLKPARPDWLMNNLGFHVDKDGKVVR